MKITATSDWRGALSYDVPVLVADVVPGDPTRCALCGLDAAPLERTALWAVKHRNPKNHAGIVRFYCLAHRPEPPRQVEPPVAPARAARAPRAAGSRARTTPRAPVAEKAAPVCPTCFVEVPATGVCGMCGERIA